MNTYIVGDLQGCCHDLEQLLSLIQFNPNEDQLWCVGDLLNRGPQSLQTLRLLKSLGNAAVCILGNHDIHAIACFYNIRKPSKQDTLTELFAANDCEALITWLRHRPLAHPFTNGIMVHAGIQPSWTIQNTLDYAHEFESALQAPNFQTMLAQLFGNEPAQWSAQLQGIDRLRVIVNTLTRMRFCSPEGAIDFSSTESANQAPEGMMPWFDIPNRASKTNTIVFGHWSTLGLINQPSLIALDTGCVWGGKLSAIRLADRKLFQVSCQEHLSPWKTKKAST